MPDLPAFFVSAFFCSHIELRRLHKYKNLERKMKKIKLGSMEWLGGIGIFLWVATVVLRDDNFSSHALYIFIMGILPNLAAAWVFTIFGKWVVIFSLKRAYSTKIHLINCAGVFIMAFLSEVVHDLFLNSPFDVFDILITVVAQVFIFALPLLVNDKYFKKYEGG